LVWPSALTAKTERTTPKTTAAISEAAYVRYVVSPSQSRFSLSVNQKQIINNFAELKTGLQTEPG